MSSAFDKTPPSQRQTLDPVLQQRKQRLATQARVRYLVRRSAPWLAAILGSLLLVLLVAGFAEGYSVANGVGFDWPWQWMGKMTMSGLEAGANGINRWTGLVLTLFIGGWGTLLGFAILRRLLRLAARGPLSGPLAIAQQSIDEAVRNKTVIVLLVILLIALALQPFLYKGDFLRHRIQFFLSYSSIFVSFLLGAVTILFSAYAVHGDLYIRRSGDVFVKPISRAGYLLGRWLGSVSMMAVMMLVWATVVAGVAVYWLEPLPANNNNDREIVSTRVLVGRQVAPPSPEPPFSVRIDERIQELARTNPERLAAGGRNVVADVLAELRSEFLRIPYRGSKTYVYTGLGEIRDRALDIERQLDAQRAQIAQQISAVNGQTVRPEDVTLRNILPIADRLNLPFDVADARLQLRFKVSGANPFGTDARTMNVTLNGNTLPVRLPVDLVETVDLPASLIDESGQLEMIIEYPEQINARGEVAESAGPLAFDPETWLLLYYPEGAFGPNVFRAALMIWIRLAFLAMLATVAGALFSYPTAATFSIAFWLLAGLTSWVQDTLYSRVDSTGSEVVNGFFQNWVQPTVAKIASIFGAFSTYNVSDLLVDGQYISYQMIGMQTLLIGLVWTGAAFAIGWYFFRRREIARVQV